MSCVVEGYTINGTGCLDWPESEVGEVKGRRSTSSETVSGDERRTWFAGGRETVWDKTTLRSDDHLHWSWAQEIQGFAFDFASVCRMSFSSCFSDSFGTFDVIWYVQKLTGSSLIWHTTWVLRTPCQIEREVDAVPVIKYITYRTCAEVSKTLIALWNKIDKITNQSIII